MLISPRGNALSGAAIAFQKMTKVRPSLHTQASKECAPKRAQPPPGVLIDPKSKDAKSGTGLPPGLGNLM
jgi:hypothetical protein